MSPAPFWPRQSPHFLACRRAVRSFTRPALIGLSGGPDSLSLVAAAAAEDVDVRALVVDHGLQAGSSDVAARAAAQAAELGVPADIVRVSVDAAPGQSLEAAARTARYAALADAASSDSSRAPRDIWVAHTLDDQAETLLLGALRGNPSGMAEVSVVEAGPDSPGRSLRLVRPFLGLRRADTVGACDELGLDPWLDPMNDDRAYRRVGVRKDIIPALSGLIGGDAAPALSRAAERIAADQELLASLVDCGPTADCGVLAAEPAPVRQRRILAWLRAEGQRVAGEPLVVSGAQLADIERLCTHWHGQGPVAINGGRGIARVGGHLTLI
ncbi:MULTISPECIES: tRNA lysidine(34) synthetase TilS [unclassified Corynebacterium]|uniref:tRNA lysidine(34) synthetase TilS n=1 Tax=unclassified Corynebacterium TaxID=2624378 RepID=UPI0026516533|nr:MULTISPECIES: tRNA lysidine(34) synthetase TilS [unclassified Corynebacterium]MDN8595012.1 tRNA lysidine(34) synthetase TilS [Corynebacterium sp. P4_F2]WKK55404.1 tRNA lysidine(34) synthetase TilS [Corynebacterium sp. P4-C1]WKK62813.1 tRNA lysidine(34) synthetase TilS [Corynebacterium sp. P8-C1]